MTEKTFDVVIAGGGTVGLTAALAISQNAELSVAIVEAIPYQNTDIHPGFDARCVALAHHSCELYQRWGMTSVDKLGHAITHIHVSDRGHLGQTRIQASDYHLSALGRVVELETLGHSLHNALERRSNVHWFCPATISDVIQQKDKVNLSLDDGSEITGRLLVIAEGGNSPTREKVNVSQTTSSYGQSAIIANIRTNTPHEGRAFERFTTSGPLALLPLNDIVSTADSCRCSLVWSLPSDEVEDVMSLDDDEFAKALQEAFGYRLGLFTDIGKRFSYPLSLSVSEQHVSHRVAIIGNASQTLHPIAGQGLNLGMRDIESLASALVSATVAERDPGAYQTLRPFADSRQKDQQQVIRLTDGLVRIFSNQYLPLVVSRNLGLITMDNVPGLRHALAKQAMGLNAGH